MVRYHESKKKKKKSRKHVTIIHIHHSGIIGCQTQNKRTHTQINTMIYFTPVGELLMQYYALVVYLTSEHA